MNILFNQYVILVLRVAHVASGLMWVGSAVLYLFFLVPAAKSAGAAGQTFMQKFGPRVSPMMGVATTLTVISGALLYSRFFVGGFKWIWTTGAGFGFTIGGFAALISYVMGVTIFGPTQGKIGALGTSMAEAGGAPRPEQIAEMERLQAYLMKTYRIDFVLLVIAVVAMAVARYL
ncbi:MAG TPA: hypothetical protein VK851_02535 [Anaerolineales bacterium]|nr:hypothetical protein [Anaerolineales bacterium]